MNGDQKTNIVRYFAYGSNLLRERILINNPTAKVHGIGKLSGYYLTFDSTVGSVSNNWYGSRATIHSGKPESYVYGVIWDLHTSDIPNLDRQESAYNPIEVNVRGEDGKVIVCRTYEMQQEVVGDPLPSPHYKKVIEAGAKQNGLPQDYIDFLESLPDNGVKETPPNYLKVQDMVEKINA